MAHGAPAGLLFIGGDATAVEKVRHGSGAALGQRILDQAAVQGNQLMAPLSVKAVGGLAFHRGHGKDPLVSVLLQLGAAQNLPGLQLLLADMAQGVVHPAELEAQLLLITHVPAVTAAAFAEPGTFRLHPAGGGGEQFFPFGKDGAVGDFQYSDFPDLAGDGPGHKHGPAVDVADALGLGTVTVDSDGKNVVLL